jgi:hypothetical protein
MDIAPGPSVRRRLDELRLDREKAPVLGRCNRHAAA